MKPLIISAHARREMERREIAEDMVREVALAPQQVTSSREGRAIHQSIVSDPETGKLMLLRVIVVQRQEDIFVLTTYMTSKVEKYWQSKE